LVLPGFSIPPDSIRVPAGQLNVASPTLPAVAFSKGLVSKLIEPRFGTLTQGTSQTARTTALDLARFMIGVWTAGRAF
jgi:hypothetical protein